MHDFNVHAFTPNKFAFYAFNQLFESSSRIQEILVTAVMKPEILIPYYNIEIHIAHLT